LIVWRGRRCICYRRTCPPGRLEHPVRPAPKSKLRPTIRARCAAGDSLDGAPGIFTLRRFVPDDRCGDVSIVAGLHAVRRSLAPIDFRRGIVRPVGKSECEKRTNDHESSDSVSRLHSCHRSAPGRFWAHAPRPILPWALPLSGFAGPDQSGHSSGLDPARIISLRKPLPAPIRSWALTASNDRDERNRRTI